MTIPITLFLGIKLSALRSNNRFVALTSRLAVVGIMLGVATLITVLSVMKGFEYEIRHSLVKELDHLQVYALNHQYPESLYQDINDLEYVRSVSGYAESYGLIKLNKAYLPLLLMSSENLDMDDGIYLSSQDVMYLPKGKNISVIMPGQDKMMPRTTDLPYHGPIENKNIKSRSIITAQVSYPVYQKITGKKHLTGLSVVVDDLYATGKIKQYIKNKYNGLYQTVDWKDRYQPLFSALRLQRTMMVFILSMITVVAMFSLVSGLIMLSSDRKSEIALLRIMGLSRWGVKQLFLIQGAFIGALGVILGIMLGLLLCHYAQVLVDVIESMVGFELIDERIYGTSKLPTVVEPLMVLSVSVISFMVSIIASIYPASKIAKMEPQEVLRHA